MARLQHSHKEDFLSCDYVFSNKIYLPLFTNKNTIVVRFRSGFSTLQIAAY